MKNVAVGLLTSLSLVGGGCASEPVCGNATMEVRTIQAGGALTARQMMPLACAEHSGRVVECASGDDSPCCEFGLGTSVPPPEVSADLRCEVRTSPVSGSAGGGLPTLVELDCPLVGLAFVLPDLRYREVGTFTLALPVVGWSETGADVARARSCCVGKQLSLSVEVVEKTGEGAASDDSAVQVRIEGTVADPEADGEAPWLAVSLELTQADFLFGCE